MPKISVVIPVYNVEPWLRECLDSVRAQTFADWECICVDDGSTDASAVVLDEYAKKDSRFKIFRRAHSNAGAVRNFGMAKATGEYLLFLDSDDVFSPWMFETLLEKAEASDADIVACGSISFCDGNPLPSFSRPDGIEWTDRTPDADWSRRPLDAETMPWNKVIRRSFAVKNNLRFLEQSSTNDLTFMALALALSGKTFHSRVRLVGYRQRIHSIQSGKSKNPKNYIRAFRAVEAGLKSRGRWDDLSLAGKGEFFRFVARCADWELSTQSSFHGYRRFRSAVRSMADEFQQSGVFPAPRPGDSLSLVRFRAIATNGARERVRAFVEAILAPILGGWPRLTGWRPRIAQRIRRIVNWVFGPKAV